MAPTVGHIPVEVESHQLAQSLKRPVTDYRYLADIDSQKDELVDQIYDKLVNIAIDRLLNIIDSTDYPQPPCLFPRAEDTFFYHDIECGDVRTEYERMLYMLSKFPERGVPVSCTKIVHSLLEELEILNKWPEYISSLGSQIEESKLEALAHMQSSLPEKSVADLSKDDFWRDPVSYETDTRVSRQLWTRSLQEVAFAMTREDFTSVAAFLQIHSFLKDPAGAVHPAAAGHFEAQEKIFIDLWNRLRDHHAARDLSSLDLSTYHHLAAQLALESSYLALPDMKDVVHVFFEHDQQMSYIYVDLDTLPRSEFSVPRRVSETVCELLDETTRLGHCELAPLTVAYTAPLRSKDNAFKVIIDGNNRATSLVLLRFLSTFEDLDSIDESMLDQYCDEHGLGLKWLVDLREALDFLLWQAGLRDYLTDHWAVVKLFESVVEAPALLVQEENFFTMCMRKGTKERPVLLQPMHQTFYNDDSLCIAFRGKAGQAHGKSRWFPILPLKTSKDVGFHAPSSSSSISSSTGSLTPPNGAY